MDITANISPQNLIEDWGNFQDWENGASAAPTEHVLSGAGASVAREATIVKHGTYSAAVTRSGADATLYYDHPSYESYQGRRVTLGRWVYATAASRARIAISDGVSSAESSYHSGAAGWEWLEVSLDLAEAATRMRFECQVNGGDTTAYFGNGMACEGDDTFINLADQSEFYLSRIPASRGIRISEYDPSRRHGIILGKPLYDKQRIKFSGEIIGSTAAAARSNFDTVKKAILSINNLRVDQGLRDIYLESDRVLRGQPSNWSDDFEPGAARRKISFDFDFTVPDVFARYINRFRHVETVSSSPDAFDLTIGGTAVSKPRVSFIADAGDITTITLENLTTGEAMTYTGTVTSGDTLVIDCHEETVVNDGADDLGNHTGDFITLLPGLNKLKFTGSDGTIKIDWFDKWI